LSIQATTYSLNHGPMLHPTKEEKG